MHICISTTFRIHHTLLASVAQQISEEEAPGLNPGLEDQSIIMQKSPGNKETLPPDAKKQRQTSFLLGNGFCKVFENKIKNLFLNVPVIKKNSTGVRHAHARPSLNFFCIEHLKYASFRNGKKCAISLHPTLHDTRGPCCLKSLTATPVQIICCK